LRSEQLDRPEIKNGFAKGPANRIASVKATQKITKAMQMVAAAKLRRAQEAAEAARPYAERMGAVLANIAFGAMPVVATRRRCWPAPARTGASARRLHRRARPVRRLQLLDRASGARERAALLAEGKTVKIITVGKKGYDILRRSYAQDRRRCVELREVRKQLGFVNAGVAEKVIADVRGRRVRRLHAVLFALQVGDLADPDGAAADPRPFEAGEAANRRQGARLRIRAGRGRILADLLPRNLAVQIFRACSKMRRSTGARR
jgi:F-type H+-transporting ATPase subunit gamma